MNAYFCQSVLMSNIWLNLVFFFSPFLFSEHYQKNSRWFACFFPCSGLGFSRHSRHSHWFACWSLRTYQPQTWACHLYRFVSFWLWCDFLILCCHLSNILEPFSFVSCQTCGWSASALVWTLLQVLVPKGSAVHQRPRKIKREKVETWSPTEKYGNKLNPKGEPHKNRNPTWNKHEKGKERNNMRQNKSGTPKKQNIPWKNCFVGSMENKLGTMNLGIFRRGLRLRT